MGQLENTDNLPILYANMEKSYFQGLIIKRKLFEIKFELQLHRGETICIVGPNGSGKTTIIKLLCLIIPPDRGVLIFNSQSILRSKYLQGIYKRKIGYVPSRPDLSFDPTVKVIDSITEVMKRFGKSPEEIVGSVKDIIKKVGLKEEIIYKYPYELSGGEIQLLALIRAVLHNPDILYMDEPISYLDVISQSRFFELFFFMREQSKVSTIMTLHNLSLANKLSDRVISLFSGGSSFK